MESIYENNLSLDTDVAITARTTLHAPDNDAKNHECCTVVYILVSTCFVPQFLMIVFNDYNTNQFVDFFTMMFRYVGTYIRSKYQNDINISMSTRYIDSPSLEADAACWRNADVIMRRTNNNIASDHVISEITASVNTSVGCSESAQQYVEYRIVHFLVFEGSMIRVGWGLGMGARTLQYNVQL